MEKKELKPTLSVADAMTLGSLKVSESARDFVTKHGKQMKLGMTLGALGMAVMSGTGLMASAVDATDAASWVNWLAYILGFVFLLAGVIQVVGGARAYSKAQEDGNGQGEDKARGQILGGLVSLIAGVVIITVVPAVWKAVSNKILIGGSTSGGTSTTEGGKK